MKKGALALAGVAILIAGAIVVSSSVGAGGGKGPYHFYSGTFFRDQNSVIRVFVRNPTSKEIAVKVRFSDEDESATVDVPPKGQNTVIGSSCTETACSAAVDIQSPSPLIIPSVRFPNSDGDIQDNLAGSFVVSRDGKRVP